ncbi:MAG: sigma 54-interacting transcriptional regulator [Polyangiaceae bacterium]
MRTERAVDPVLAAVEQHGEPSTVLLLLGVGGACVVTLAPGAPVIVGRDQRADVRVEDRRLSSRHARFTLHPDDGSVLVEDLGSTNGTWVGGARVTGEARVGAGAEVRLGSTVARVVVFGSPDAPEAEPASSDMVAGPSMRALLATLDRVASSHIAVLLRGETGTGKELLARRLHARSPRAKKSIVSLNCGAIPRDLVEGTLFGHERGAFTGAAATQRGVFEEASGGTVLLDEIGELPLAAQAALLRVLETGRIQRVGSPREIDVDVRIVAATHRDLLAMSKRGLFREDLYFRIAAVTLDVPPLRDRTDEIPALVERFIRVANERHRRSVKAVSDDAMARLLAHDWPGNVRELRNAVERAVVVACDSTLGLPDLPPSLLLQPAPQSTPPPRDSAPSSAPDTEGALPERVGRFERDLIVRALHDASGNKAEAARKLGIPVRTLAYRIKVLGIDEGKPT